MATTFTVAILLCRDCINRWDFITGWNYTRVTDNTALRIDRSSSPIRRFPPARVITTLDQFTPPTNSTAESSACNGSAIVATGPGKCSLACPSAICGRHQHQRRQCGQRHGRNESRRRRLHPRQQHRYPLANEFTAITEIGYNLGYRFAPCTTLIVGYTFMYFNDILSPANNFDTTVNPNGGATRPTVLFHHSDFWVQGLNIGITKEF